MPCASGLRHGPCFVTRQSPSQLTHEPQHLTTVVTAATPCTLTFGAITAAAVDQALLLLARGLDCSASERALATRCWGELEAFVAEHAACGIPASAWVGRFKSQQQGWLMRDLQQP
jgi:hypothetical protein